MKTATAQSSRDIEREVEGTRAALALTLAQLRENLTPTHLMDELLFQTRVGAASLTKSMESSVRQNPLPLLLVGVGLAILLTSKRRSRKTLYARRIPESVDALNGANSPAVKTAGIGGNQISFLGDIKNRVASACGSIVDTAYDEIKERTSAKIEEYEKVATDVVRDVANQLSGSVARAIHDVVGNLGTRTSRH